MASPDYRWEHNDTRGMSTAVMAAIARCAGGGAAADTWPAGDAQARADLRALLVATMFMIDSLSTRPPTSETDGLIHLGERIGNDWPDKARAAIADALLQTWRTIVVYDTRSNEPVVQTPEQFRTVDGGTETPIVPVAQAGFGWPVAAVAIVGVTVQAGVICYIADKVSTIIDNELTRNEATNQMVRTHSAVLQVLSGHRAAEEAAGAQMPLSTAEQAAIGALIKAQTEAQKSIKLEVPSLFPNLSKSGDKIIGAATNLGYGALAIAALIAYVILKGK